MNPKISDLWRWDGTVNRGTYFFWGALLAGVKLEGAICLLMAAPLAFFMATFGGVIAYVAQRTFWQQKRSPRVLCAAILVVPVAMGIEHVAPLPLPLLEVTSSVVINAPPEKVWRHVVSFPELPPPTEMIFKMGVAYPIQTDARAWKARRGTSIACGRTVTGRSGPTILSTRSICAC